MIGEVLVFDASRGVKTKRQWWRPWRKIVVEWKGSQRSLAAQNWIVESYLADKWDIDLYAHGVIAWETPRIVSSTKIEPVEPEKN